ncbi:uncharacterized protein BDR25DRAFT_269263 [Lindgomyces ingoldianus]|uniref:Uncharacterized protein n=1 Tax=Lindgomyces ingoldianus TaxID=673940 RepID=A0ACB6QGU6_9PLEO|nr:uncharacterized protein BDR25DRAFT_269263 [Lindgomyces ingoldianus]KAF2466110.1 hypothetical protein BDR25DRAFT_269263 [Lindgomyces ingoldianus]
MEQATSTENGGELNPLNSTGLCLLSLDGGGVRGLSTLYILKGLMDRLNQDQKNVPPLKPCEVFDLIGGTSTGGLIAIMLGRLEMDADECITAYTELMKTVFETKRSWFPASWTGNIKSRFDTARLESAIKEVITSHGAKETDLFNDGVKRGCRVFVCTIAYETRDIIRLRSYDSGKLPIRATILQAALATSAATTFFDPVTIGARKFADGGLGANNPVDEVEGEASDIWCSETGDLKPLVKCFVSIGTGNPGKKAIEDNMLKFLSGTLVDLVTQTENTEKRFIAKWAQHFDKKRYFRFNVDQGLQDVGLAEYQEQGAIEAATDGYLDHKAQEFRVRDCIQNLKLKQSMAATDLSYIISEYNEQRIVELRATSRAEALWNVPFQKNQRFVGRTAELAQINTLLANEIRCEQVAIVGLGGIGKTQIALEFAHQWREKYPDCAVFWVPVTNVKGMLEAYLEIGHQLHIPNIEKEREDVQKLVQHRLGQEGFGKWLLVFDNADDIDMWTDKADNTLGSKRRIDYLPKSKHGSILFTTRSRKAAIKLAGRNVVSVGEMDYPMAKALLEKSLIDQDLLIDDQASTDLLQKLTYLPLAIVQAAAYINENQISLSEYAALLDDTEQNVIDILCEEFEDEGRYRDITNPIATTWLISFEQIRTRDPLAAEYLSFMSCIDAKDIPQSLLPPAQSNKKAVDAMGTLTAYSFISKHKADQLLDVHLLVHLATRNWLRTQGSLGHWTAEALTRLEKLFLDSNHMNRSVWRLYLRHARYVLKTPLDADGISEEKMTLLWKFGACTYSDGRYKEAEEAYTKLVEMSLRKLGEEHPDTLTSKGNLALTFGNQGRWKEAEELDMQVMEVRKRVLGEDHPDTLTSMGNLALTYWNQGRWKEAEELQEKGLSIYFRVLGEEHPETLNSMGNLASTYRNQGRRKEAEELEVQVVEMRKRVLGEEHPETLTSMGNLASTYRYQGRWKEAEELDVQVVETFKRVLGEEHPDMLISMGNLAFTYRNQGRWKEAEELEVQVMETRKRVLGNEHPNTLTSMGNLALTYMNQGRWKEAEELDVQGMEMRKKVLGEEHPDTLISMANLASTYKNQGRWREAEELNVRVMEARKRVLGEEHPDTLASMGNLASTYRNQGWWKEAEELDVKAMEMRKRVLGEEHPETLASMSNLALTYWNQGRWKEAEELEAKGLGICLRVLGEEHPDTLISMGNLASMYRDQGRWKEAEELEVEVVGTRKRVLGEEHPDTLISVANLASTYRNQGRWKEAEELDVKAMETFKRVLGEEHPDVLTSMANLASTYRNQGRWKEAEELEVQVVETRKRVLRDEHPDTLTSMGNLAFTFWNQGRWEEAEKLGVQVMETRKRVLGEDHPDTLTSMGNLASTYWNQGQWKEAEKLGVQVMETRKRVLGEDHPSTLTSMGNLALTLWNQGRWKEAEELEVQVVETFKRVLGEEHPETLTSMGNLASTYRDQGRWKEAEELEVQVAETKKRVLGEEHPDTLTSINNLAFRSKA